MESDPDRPTSAPQPAPWAMIVGKAIAYTGDQAYHERRVQVDISGLTPLKQNAWSCPRGYEPVRFALILMEATHESDGTFQIRFP